MSPRSRPRRPARALAAVLVPSLALCACGRPPLRQLCRMIREDVVAEGFGSYIREVALARDRRGLVAAWTDASGTYARGLGLDGAPGGPALRVAAPAESLDLAATPEGFALGVLVRGDLFAGGGSAELLRLGRDGRPLGAPAALGRAGAYSKGIAVALLGASPVVVWHDGAPGAPAVWLAGADGEARRLSSTRRSACCPDVATGGAGGLVVWGEHEVSDESRGLVLARRLGRSGGLEGGSTLVARSAVPETWPVVVAAVGGFSLGYRDLEDERAPQLFHLALDGEGRRQGRPRRIGRYDGPTAATLLALGPRLAATEVRSWSREQIVAFDRFGRDGERIGAQLHVFFDHIRLTDVDAVAVGTRYLLLYGEDHPRQRVWLGQIGCR